MILACGEGLVDLVSTDGVTFTARPGGGPFNAAVAGARLGARFGFMGRLSDDRFGRQLRDHLAAEGVDDRWMRTGPEPTTLAVATTDDSGSADYVFYVQNTVDWQWQPSELQVPGPDVGAILVGALALEISPGRDQLARFVADTAAAGTATVVYDPDVRLRLGPDGAAAAERIVRLAHLVKTSTEDLTRLYPRARPEDSARRWANLGPQIVVLTAGPNPVGIFRRNGTLDRVPVPQVAVVDSIGAGNTFAAALLIALEQREGLGLGSGQGPAARLAAVADADLRSAVRWAARAAAVTCGRVGADPPTPAELQAWCTDD